MSGAAPMTGGPSEGPRLLLVDDRPDNLLALQAVLEPLGLPMVSAASGEEALRLLLQEEFSLIVLDVQMPGLDGFATARLIKAREKTRHIPIIFLTAISGAKEHHLEGYASGALDYVYKPFEPAILRAKVTALVELMSVKARLENEVAERSASERLLAERDRQMSEAESLAHVGAWTWDLGSDGVTWSSELFRILGLEPDSVPVSLETYLEHVHPDDRSAVDVALREAAAAGRPFRVQHRSLRADGSVAWIRGHGRPVRDEAGTLRYFEPGQDITERRRAEETFTQFFNLSLDLMSIASLDGRFERVNRSFSAVLGWSEDELLERSYLDLVAPEDREAMESALVGLAEGRDIWDRELRMMDRDGRTRWFRLSARPVPEDGVIYVVAIDITDRKAAATLLAESEERFRTLVEHAPEAIVVVDLDTELFVDANPRAEELFGVTRAGLLAMGPKDLTAPGATEWPLSLEPAGGDAFEWTCTGAAGERALCEVRLLAIPASGRRLARGTLVDITRRRQVEEAEQAVIAQEAALRQAQQIAATLQRSLLPEGLPEIPGLGLAATYLPGSAGLEVGGDWYDVFGLAGGAIALAIGDVVGRGLEAATTMGRLRTALRAYAMENSAPAWVVKRLSRLARSLPAAEMATLVYAVYEPATGVMTYLCAGHPPPLVVHPDGTTAYLEGGRVTPLGLPAFGASEGRISVEAGSMLVFYTDGLMERPGSGLDEGMAALASAAGRSTRTDAEGLLETITGEMIGDAARDDVAVLVVAFAGQPSETFAFTLNSDPQGLSPMRDALALWLTHAGALAQERQDLVLAVSEAVTNSIIHAFGAQDGTVEVRAETSQDDSGATLVRATVRDNGSWRSSETSTGGWGLALMKALLEDCQVTSGPEGTEVTMLRRIGGGPQEASGTSNGEANGAADVRGVIVAAGPAPRRAPGLGPALGAPAPGASSAAQGDEIVTVAVEEDIDAANAERVGAWLAGAVGNRRWGLVVDLSEAGYLDSSGIRMLLDLHRRLERNRQDLWVVVPPGAPAHRVLELSKVNSVVRVAGSVEEGVAALSARRRGFPPARETSEVSVSTRP